MPCPCAERRARRALGTQIWSGGAALAIPRRCVSLSFVCSREGVAFARDAIGTSRSCDNLDWPSRTSESLRPPVACRLLCESPELRLAPLSLAVLGGR